MTKKLPALFLFLAFTTLLSVFSCKDKMGSYKFDYQYDYFPLDSAHYVDYDVDSITYNYNSDYVRDTARYQLREIITDTFYDNLNQLNYTLELYRRPDSTAGWTFFKKWFAHRDTTRLMVTEDDLKFVKLVFPPQSNETWNGNEFVPSSSSYAVFQSWNYHYGNVDSTVVINGVTYNHAVSVGEVDEETFVTKTLRHEVYARGVGMVYQEWENLSKNNVLADWNTGPENGFRIRMYVRGHNP